MRGGEREQGGNALGERSVALSSAVCLPNTTTRFTPYAPLSPAIDPAMHSPHTTARIDSQTTARCPM